MAPPIHNREMVIMLIYFILGVSALQVVSSWSNNFDGVVIPNKGKQSNVPVNAFIDDELVHILDHVTFNCNNMKPGYYADVQMNCQVFHYCKWDGTKSTFTCPKGFQFNQETETCDNRGIKCGISENAVTDIPSQDSTTDQIPATSPATTTTSPSDEVIPIRRIRRHTVWIQDPTQTQHQLAASNLFIPQHFLPQPVAAASSSSSSVVSNNGNGPVFHLLIPSPQQQQQQQPQSLQQPIFQVVSDMDPFQTLSTATQSQRHLGMANLVAAPTVTPVTTRQGQISRSSRPGMVHNERPTEHLFGTDESQPMSFSQAVGFGPRRQEHHFAPPQFFIENPQDASDTPDAVFSEAPQQNFVSTPGQGSRRDNAFFPPARPPPFSDNDFRQPFDGFQQGPRPNLDPRRSRPRHHENQQPQANFVINPEDLTLINEIRFPGPPQDSRQTTTQRQPQDDNGRGSSADRRPTFQQRPPQPPPQQSSSNPRHRPPQSPPAPSSQGFLSHDEHLSRFPQRFPAESPDNFNFAPQHRQPPLRPFQHPPPFFSQNFPPPTSFGDFPVQQTSRPVQPPIQNGRPHQPQTLNDGFTPSSVPFIGNIPRDQQDTRPLHLGPPQPISAPPPPPRRPPPPPSSSSPRPLAPTTNRGQTSIQPQSNMFHNNHNSRRQPNRVNSLATTSPSPPAPKKPVFSNIDTAPPTDTTEEFGIPPPTESFGIKLGQDENDELVHSTSTPSKLRSKARPAGGTQTSRPQSLRPPAPPPSQFFSAAPPSVPTASQPDRFFTTNPPLLQPSSQQPNDDHFRESSTPLSNDVRTHANRPSAEFSQVFGLSAENEGSNIRHNVGQNFNNGFFRPPPPPPPQSSSEANFDNGGQQFRQPFHGQVDETSSIENLDDTDGQRGNIPNFAPFHNQPRPGFSNFEGPFDGNNRGFLADPTFGPQSVDQLAPPDIPSFTTRPNMLSPSDTTLGTSRDQQDNSKLIESTENESQFGPVRSTEETTGIAESTTRDPTTVTPNGKRTRIPIGVTTSGRKGLRTRPARVKAKTTTSQPPSTSATVSHRRRGRPTTTTSPPVFPTVSSAPTTRRRKPFLRRKTTTSTATPTISELNDITTSGEIVSMSSSNSRKRGPTGRRFNKDNSTETPLRRRRPLPKTRTTSTPSSTLSTTSLRSSSSSSDEDSFPASVSHHSSGISRDQLVTTSEHTRHRNINIKSKTDTINDGTLQGLESKEQPIVTKTDGVEVASLEPSVHEHSALVTDHTSSATTSVDTTTAGVTRSKQSTTSTTTTTTVTPSTTVEAVTETTTTSSSTTEKPSSSGDGKPEAMAKLRSLLSRKFIIKQTTEKPNSD